MAEGGHHSEELYGEKELSWSVLSVQPVDSSSGSLGSPQSSRRASSSSNGIHTKCKEELGEMRRHLEQMFRKVDQLQTQVIEMQKSIQDMKDEKAQLDQKVKEKEARIGQLERDKSDLEKHVKAERDERDTKIAQLRKNIDEEQKQKSELQARIKQLEKEKSALERSLSASTEETSQMKAERDQMQTKRDQMRTERDQMETERDQMQTDRDQLKKEGDKMAEFLYEQWLKKFRLQDLRKEEIENFPQIYPGRRLPAELVKKIKERQERAVAFPRAQGRDHNNEAMNAVELHPVSTDVA